MSINFWPSISLIWGSNLSVLANVACINSCAAVFSLPFFIIASLFIIMSMPVILPLSSNLGCMTPLSLVLSKLSAKLTCVLASFNIAWASFFSCGVELVSLIILCKAFTKPLLALETFSTFSLDIFCSCCDLPSENSLPLTSFILSSGAPCSLARLAICCMVLIFLL